MWQAIGAKRSSIVRSGSERAPCRCRQTWRHSALSGLLAASVFGGSMNLLGCSTKAAVVLKNGHIVKGTLRRAEAGSLSVGKHQVNVDEIAKIDHPGNVAALIGASILAYGALVFAIDGSDCDLQRKVGPCAAIAFPGVLGLGMTSWGLYTWVGSKEEAETSGFQPELGWTLQPSYQTAHRAPGHGLSARYRF